MERSDVVADAPNNMGVTPLSTAAAGGHVSVVELLLAQLGVKADQADNGGQTPLAVAAVMD